MPLHLTLDNVEYGVLDTALPQVNQQNGEPGPPLPTKLLRFVEPQSGIIVDIPLPNGVPFGREVSEGFKPPAQDVGERLLGSPSGLVRAGADVLAKLGGGKKPGQHRPKR